MCLKLVSDAKYKLTKMYEVDEVNITNIVFVLFSIEYMSKTMSKWSRLHVLWYGHHVWNVKLM